MVILCVLLTHFSRVSATMVTNMEISSYIGEWVCAQWRLGSSFAVTIWTLYKHADMAVHYWQVPIQLTSSGWQLEKFLSSLAYWHQEFYVVKHQLGFKMFPITSHVFHTSHMIYFLCISTNLFKHPKFVLKCTV